MHELRRPSQPWGRLCVVRGASPQTRSFQAHAPCALEVGSAPSAQLRLPLPSVAPQQFELLWDGAALWLQDRLRLGTTLVNGQPLNEWSLVRGHVLVRFGSVCLWLAAASPEPPPRTPNFAPLEQAHEAALLGAQQRRTPTLRLVLGPLAAQLSEAVGS